MRCSGYASDEGRETTWFAIAGGSELRWLMRQVHADAGRPPRRWADTLTAMGGSLWHVSASEGEFVGGDALRHGMFQDGCVCRYGRDASPVSLPSDRLVVSSSLSGSAPIDGVESRRVRALVVRNQHDDWREWGDASEQRMRSLRRKLDFDETEDLFIPWDIMGRDLSDDELRALTQREGLSVVQDPGLIWFAGSEGLKQVVVNGEGTRSVECLVPGLRIYRVPWLFDGDVFVDDDVRSWLEGMLEPGEVEFKEIEVV